MGIILDPEERVYVQEQLEDCLDNLHELTGKSEFHFTDIYNRRGEWQGSDDRLAIAVFFAFCEIFHHLGYPFLLQTCDPNFFKDNGIVIRRGAEIDGLRLYDYREFALFFLLMSCKWYLSEKAKKYSLPIDFVVDEGLYRSGHYQKSNLLRDIARHEQFVFRNSKEFKLLQLADFGAFALNRMQLLLVKGQKRTSFDDEVLRALSHANLNFVNIEKTSVSLDEMDADSYDYFQYSVRVRDGSGDRRRILEELEMRGLGRCVKAV